MPTFNEDHDTTVTRIPFSNVVLPKLSHENVEKFTLQQNYVSNHSSKTVFLHKLFYR